LIEDQIKINREQLYTEIWEIAVTGVSKKYNIPYNRLMKICKDNLIPTPPAGYWTSLSFGKQVEKIALPKSSILDISLGNNTKERVKAAVTVINKKVSEESSEKQIKHAKSSILAGDKDGHIIYKQVRGTNNIYKREQLYQEVWDKPVVEVAVQYGVSNVTIHKICKALNVPVPSRGYWARLRAGKKLKKVPLPPTKGATQKIGPRTFEEVKMAPERTQSLSFLADEECQKVLETASRLKLTTENKSLHKKIIAYKSVVNEWNKKDIRPEGAQRSFKNYSKRPPFLAGVISTESLQRVYGILDSLYCEAERLGGTIDNDLSLQIRNEHVIIEVVEAQDEVKHEITRPEAQAMIKYEDAKRHHTWATEPQIRKYDFIFNGKLRINIRQGRYFRDTDNIKIESKLGEMLIELYEESEVVRINREEWEEAERKRDEEERSKEERRNRYNDEVDRTIELQNQAFDFQISSRIRDYIEAVKNCSSNTGLDDKTVSWIEWATKKADWFDPTMARHDELFGRRRHEKKEEDKALKRAGYYW